MIPKWGNFEKPQPIGDNECSYGKNANARRNSLIIMMTLNGGIGNGSSLNRW